MAQTFDTSRVGGGTYELAQDANGNYKLKSVGFQQINKLNLPDLATSDATKSPVATIPKQPKIDDPFKKLAVQNTGNGEGGGSQDYSNIRPREAKVKEASISEIGQRTNTTYNAMTDAEKNAIATGTSGMTFRGAETSVKNPSIGFGQGQVDPSLAKAAGMSSTIDTTKTYTTPRTIADQNEYLGRTFTDKTTGLQKAQSAVSSTVQNILNNSGTVAIAKTAGKLIGGIGEALLGVTDVDRRRRESDISAANSLGYTTNSELGNSTDPFRIAAVRLSDGTLATSSQQSVFVGMNKGGAKSNLSKSGAKRVTTRMNIGQPRVDARYGKNSKEAKEFREKTKNFQKELNEFNSKKEAQKKEKNIKSQNPNLRAGAGNEGGGCFIKGTLITMFDGSKKPVEQVDLGDKVAEGGNVFAAGRFLNTELYDYKGIKVSGSHMVNEDGTWMRVRDTKHGKSLGDDLNTVYVFGSENRRILINDILFTDYFEVSEQDKLIEDSEDFFNNWKDYGNDVDVDNVATLNMNYEI